MQAARHDKHYAISSIAAHPCKNTQGWGTHVLIWERKEKAADKGGPPAYSDDVKEINSLLNSNGGILASALAGLSGAIFPTDKAYADVLADVRNGLGHDIDFGNQQDREAIGNALANHIQQGNGCDLAGDRAHGCLQ
jgi:hypothetical protein